MAKRSETSKMLSDIKEGFSEKISGIIEGGKETVKAIRAERESRENLEAVRAGFAKGKKEKLAKLKEEAKVKAMLEFRARQELEQKYQQPQQVAPQIQLPRRRSGGMFSFTNRPFMETDPFIGDNPFFPRKRRPL